MKIWQSILATGGCLSIGAVMFVASFYQHQSQELVNPYSTQAAIVTRDVPEPWKFLLRWGGGTIALIGGTGFAGAAVRKLEPKLSALKQALECGEEFPIAALPPSTSIPIAPLQSRTQEPLPNLHLEQGLKQADEVEVTEPSPVLPCSPFPRPLASPPMKQKASLPFVEPEIPPISTPTPAQTTPFRINVTENQNESILDLVNAPAVLFYGDMGAGKSSKSGWLAGEHVKRGDAVLLVNPLSPFVFFEGIRTFGKGENYEDAARGIEMFTTEVSRRLKKRGTQDYNPFNEQHLHLICDEMTNWEDAIAKSHPQVLEGLIEVCTQKLRQANASATFISHGDTLTCLGGRSAGAGKKDVLKRQFLRVQCVSKREDTVPGGKCCAGYAYLRWMEGDQERFKKIVIPEWMQPPNPQTTPNGQKWYDFRPLIPDPLRPLQQWAEINGVEIDSDCWH